MKRIVLIIGALLLGLAMRAQSVTYTCRYWFDQNFAQAATTTFSTSTWQAELDVGSLTEGLHALHLHVMDTSMKWSAPQSYLFLKLTPPAASTDFTYYYWFDQDHASMQSGALGDGHLLLDVDDLSEGLHAIHVMLKGGEYSASQTYLFFKADAWESGTPNYVYHCWFDEDFANQQTDALGSGHLLLDVADLEEGMHAVHVLVEGNTLTSTQSYMFMKVAPFAADSLDMSHLAYRCWFDEDFEHQQTDSIGDGHFLLDVNDLEDGLHTVHVMLQGSILTATQSYMFMKMAVEDPSAEMQYICWFDQDYSSAQTGPLGSGLFELEVSNLTNGLHTVNVQLDNGTRTATQCYLFYKQPLGGYGIARWEYWLNDDFEDRSTTVFTTSVDTLDIISLLTVGHPALRSSCFHFHPNGDAPYINAKNQINFRFWDSEMHFIDKSTYYVDEQVEQDVVATVFERNTTETFAAPRNNQITWYKLDAGVGDSLVFVANKACTMQLFAPSGEEVYAATASEAMVFGGCHVWEDGTYFLAVHDVTGSGETLSVTYNWVYRYAILAYDVHLVGNGGCSTITFNGNGYNSLLDVYLVNVQNDTIRNIHIGHEGNTATTVTFNFYEENLGVYDAVFVFYDETIRVNSALGVQEPVDIVLTSTVSYPSRFLRNTPCTYTFTITNEGNMTAYNVPLYVYIGTNTLDGISHLTINGLKLKKIHEYIDNFADYTEQEQQDLKQLSELIGEDHYFGPYINANANGDSVAIRAGYFIADLAPYESRTVSFDITSSQTIELWLSMPDEWAPISAFSNEKMLCFNVVDTDGQWNQTNDRSHFCCWHDGFEAGLSALSTAAGTVAMIGFFMPDLLTTAGAGAAELISLVSGLAGTLSGLTASVWCQENPPQDLFDWMNQNKGNGASLLGNVLNAASKRWPGIKIIDAASAIGGPILDAYGMSNSLASREEAHKSSMCTDNPPKGGISTPVNSLDPNDIHGYLSESGSHYMRQEIQNVQYEIEFENDTTLATAAAHTIIVRDTLDAAKFDLNSLAARSVTIGDKRLDLNGEQIFARTLDLRPELYVIAQIEQDYDPTTGIIQWTIQSLDPMTMEPTDDPNQGVLPVNYYGNGVGFIDYSVNLLEPFADGTAISNRAGIIFDQEEVIMTPTWTNIIDAVKPTSYIEEVTFEDDTLNFSFVSSDNRSGMWYHILYYRNDSTEMEWQVKVPRIFENSYMLRFDEYQTTEYLVMAVDSAGNVEDKEMMAEYVYYYDGPAPACQTFDLIQGWNWFSTYLDITLNDLKAALVEAAPNTSVAIKSRTQNTTYNPNTHRWSGSMAWDLSMMYRILVTNDCQIVLEGLPINPAEHPVTISNGVNWIAFPLNMSMSVTNAFNGFAVNGDQIKSRLLNAQYRNNRWNGQLDILVPGQGYIYISDTPGERIFTFPVGGK